MPVPLLLEDSGWAINDVIATPAVTNEMFTGALVPSIRGEPFAVRPHAEQVADPFKSRLRKTSGVPSCVGLT